MQLKLVSVLGSRRGAECVREGGGVWLDTGTGGNAAYCQESYLPAALHVGKIILVVPYQMSQLRIYVLSVLDVVA